VSDILESLGCVLSTNVEQNFLSTSGNGLAAIPQLVQFNFVKIEEKSRVGSFPAALHMKRGMADFEVAEH